MSYLNNVAIRIKQDGGISITRFSVKDVIRYNFQDEGSFISWYMNRIAPGETYQVISEDVIPKNENGKWDKTNRNEWSFINGLVQVDSVKVNKNELKKQEIDAIFAKLPITKLEFKKILGK